MEYILREKTDDGIVTLTLNRPEKLNAFNRRMKDELYTALRDFDIEHDSKFCILTGAGKAFSAGEDLGSFNLDDSPEDLEFAVTQALKGYHRIVREILTIRKPIVAALNGTAAGAGLSIALACDDIFVVPRSGDKPNMLVPGFSSIGLVPDSGMVVLLERYVTPNVAEKWFEPGFVIPVRQAVTALGFEYNDDFSDEKDMLEEVSRCARNLMVTRSLREYGFTKWLRNTHILERLEKVFEKEIGAQVECVLSKDFREGRAAFLEKRKPVFNQ